MGRRWQRRWEQYHEGAGLGGTGSGLWGGTNWYNGSADIAWSDGNDAVFWGPTAGTLSPTTTRSVNSLSFKTNGYVLQGSTVNLAGPSVTVDTGATSILSVVSGTAGLVKAGAGALHLGNFNTYSGGTTVNGGVLGIITGALGALPSSPTINITLDNGSTLRFNEANMALNVNRQMFLGFGGGIINTNGFNGEFSGVISGGELTKTGAGTLTLTNNNTHTDGTTISAGTLLVNNVVGRATGTGQVSVSSGATLGGSGRVLAVINNGIVAPGDTIGPLFLDGGYLQGAGGKLEIQLSSLVNYDKLILSNAATLSGTLAVSLVNGFVPQAGNTFDIFFANGFNNTEFTTTDLPVLPGGLGWSVNYGPNSITLSVTIPGDFNKSGTVDGADYIVWRNGLGTTYQQSDYGVWRSHFGQTSSSAGGGTSIANVPEPATWLLIGASALALSTKRRRYCAVRRAKR